MKLYFSVLFSFLLCLPSLAQVTFFNQGEIFINANAIVQVNGNLENNTASSLTNNGELTVSSSNNPGDFTNNSGLVDGTGAFFVEGNWTNNASDNLAGSAVVLFGGDQLITGSNVTGFFDLELTGAGIKRQTIDVIVNNQLILNDRELATDSNTMFVTNPSATAVTNDQTFGAEGFVSSLENGALSRATASTSGHLFPVGSSLGTRRYRAVMINPASASSNTFTVRFINEDAENDGLLRSNKDASLCKINEKYWHEINRTMGSDSADITIYYELSDGQFDALANCKTAVDPWWQDMGNVTASTFTNYLAMTSPGWNDFSWDPYALGITGDVLADFDTNSISVLSESYQFTDNTNGFSVNWSWDFGDGSVSDEQNPDHEFDGPGIYEVKLVVASNKGCVDSTYKTIEVQEGIMIPNVFSPNNDGINDFFKIPAVGESEFQLEIFNRWGEHIFRAQSNEIVWDGRTFAGEEVPEGTYYFVLKAMPFTKNGEIKGHVTLLR